mmetsp:Transcript_28030/g.70934  ORF Transcript_28030/g.70934 Transcript_28030/m.70934 type:complete len:304 (+) Transcript_28030:73-984(+)
MEAEEEQSTLLRVCSRALGMPLPPDPAAEQSDSSSSAQPELLRQDSQANRDRVEENQRRLAQELLLYSVPIMGCTLCFILALLIAGIVIYVWGLVVWFSSADKACDQPLKWWLLATLLVPILQFHCSNRTESRPNRLQALVMPIVICVGIFMCSFCRTCAETNPDLFKYASMYLIYHSVVCVTMMFITFGMVSVIFWLHRHGLLESGPGAARAARPGLINDIETVEYSPSLFVGEMCNSSDDGPECPICQDTFDESKPIKRTPCGHLFHEDCLGNWLENFAKSCPLCRVDLQEALPGPPSGDP